SLNTPRGGGFCHREDEGQFVPYRLDSLILVPRRAGAHGLMKKPQTAPVAKQVVLIIDDDPTVRSSLKFSLEVEGFTVRAYSGPHEFLNEADLPAKSCLLVDYYMPGMTGLELLARLRDRGVSIPAMI